LRFLVGVAKKFATGRTSLGALLQTGFSNVLIQGLYAVSGIISARALGPSGRGMLAAIIMWPQFLSYLLTIGIPASSVYNVRRDPAHRSTYAAAAMAISAIMGSVAVLLGYLVIPYSLRTYPPAVVHMALLVVFLAPVALLTLSLTELARSSGIFGYYNFFRVAQPASVCVALFLIWKLGGLTYWSGALVYLLAGIPFTVWNILWIRSHFRPSFKGGARPVRSLLNYGVRVWGADLLGTVANQVDRVFVVSMLQPHDMGLYVVAQSAAGLMGVFPNAMAAVLMPRAAGHSVQEIVTLTGRALRVAFAGLLLIALCLFFAGGFLLNLVYGSRFDGAFLVLRILLAEGVLDGLTLVSSQAFLAAGIPGIVTFLQGCGLLTAVPLLLWMVPRWGLQGAAYALLISTACRLTFVLVSFRTTLKMPPPGIILKQSDIRSLMGH